MVKRKLVLNGLRYRTDLCLSNQSGMPKWTDLATGQTKDSTFEIYLHTDVRLSLTREKNVRSLRSDWISIASEVKHFAAVRGWLGSYNERTLRLALASEVGELATVLQWESDTKTMAMLPKSKVNSLCEELADIAIYVFHYYRTIKGISSVPDFLDTERNDNNKEQVYLTKEEVESLKEEQRAFMDFQMASKGMFD